MALDPSIARFVALHSASVVEEVEADVAPWRDATPADRWRGLRSLGGATAWVQNRSPAHRRRVLTWRDPPNAGYYELLERLKQPAKPTDG